MSEANEQTMWCPLSAHIGSPTLAGAIGAAFRSCRRDAVPSVQNRSVDVSDFGRFDLSIFWLSAEGDAGTNPRKPGATEDGRFGEARSPSGESDQAGADLFTRDLERSKLLAADRALCCCIPRPNTQDVAGTVRVAGRQACERSETRAAERHPQPRRRRGRTLGETWNR